MDGDNCERIIIPSPLKKRDFIHHEGREYQIMKYIRVAVIPARDRDDDDYEGLVFKARDIRTNHVVDITLPVTIEDEQEEEDNYFQILELNEDKKEMTLKSFMTGNERKIKMWLDDDDIDLTKDGLMEEDQELFCTLKEVFGKEMIGDFKFAPKVHPIMTMPDEMLDMIFSKLTPEDRLSCRLVTRRWATLLPINKFVKCRILFIDHEPDDLNLIRAEFHLLDTPNYPIVEYFLKDRNEIRADPDGDVVSAYGGRLSTKDFQPLIDASVLEDVDYLSIVINAESNMDHHIQTTVTQHCHKLNEFDFQDYTKHGEAKGPNWVWIKQIIAGSAHHLKILNLLTDLRELDLSLEIRGCTSLQEIHLKLPITTTHSVLKVLESVPRPTNIIVLQITGEATFTKSQLLWITSKFPQLQYARLRVRHNHSDNPDIVDNDEVDGDTIQQVLNVLPSLQRLTLDLCPSLRGGGRGREGGCLKANHLRDQGLAPFRTSLSDSPSGAFETLKFQRT